jgi:hypothetical protein
MRFPGIVSAMILATASVAKATGGFDCQIDDENLNFFVSGSISHGLGGRILGYQAEAEIKAESVPEALRKPDMSDSLVHHWLDYPDLWLQFYAETTGDTPFASFDLIIKAEATEDELTYEGEYLLSVFDGDTGEVSELTGTVTCGGE